MDWEEIEKQFDFEIPGDEPLFPMNIVCELLHMQYHVLHEIMKQGLLRDRKRKKHSKLFSSKEIKRLKYIKYLMHEKGVNLNGVKLIIRMESKD
ncbi:MAG: MerR family transcriptional regulator [Candidatus Omnitrophica bacterium]|nr:MerR family transcriptional regulator [Candidatus Omnitrophota bacterium]